MQVSSGFRFSGNPVIAPRWTPGGPCSQVPDGFQEREISRLECVLSLRLSDLPALHKELGAFTIGTDQPVLLRTEGIRKIAVESRKVVPICFGSSLTKSYQSTGC
jgi:hypothetical protein